MTTTTPLPPRSRRPRAVRTPWLVPAGLILLGLVPMLAGALRLSELAGGAAVTSGNARFFASPEPVVIHIVASVVFCLLGAFQFVPVLRGRNRWHRMAGVVLIPMGIAAALSGMWMAVAYDLPDHDGVALVYVRLVFGALMVASIVLAVRAIVRRDHRSHGAWMTRAYALGLAAGTQAILLTAMSLAVDIDDPFVRVVGMAGAWLINLGVAEVIIRRRRARASSRRKAPRTVE